MRGLYHKADAWPPHGVPGSKPLIQSAIIPQGEDLCMFPLFRIQVVVLFLLFALAGRSPLPGQEKKPTPAKPPSAEEAKAFMEAAEARLLELSTEADRAAWVKSTYITDDTEILAAQASERFIAATVDLAKQLTR